MNGDNMLMNHFVNDFNEQMNSYQISKKEANLLLASMSVEEHCKAQLVLSVTEEIKDSKTQRFFINQKSVHNLLGQMKDEDFSKCIDLIKLPYDIFWIEAKFKEVDVGCLVTKSNRLDELCHIFVVTHDKKKDAIFYYTYTLFRPYVEKNKLYFSVGEYPYFMEYSPEEKIRLCKTHASYLTDYLIFINSPRVCEITECQNFEKVNKKREKKFKEPLLSYRVVDLNKEERKRMGGYEHSDKGEIAFHARRGHYMTLTNDRYKNKGMVWRKNTWVGNKKYGEVIKAYVAKEPLPSP